MKKLLGSTLALAMVVPASASAELLKNFKVGGQLDVQATSARNTADFTTRGTTAAGANDRLGNTHTRMMLSGMWDVLDDVHAKVTLVKGGEQGAGTPRLYGQAAENLNTVQTNTLVQEAFVKIDKMLGHVDTTVGRQFYGEPGDIVVYYGPRDNYGLRTDSLDAFRLDWKGEHMAVTGVAGRTSTPGGSTLATNADATSDLRGLVLSCNQHENVKPSVYVYNQVVHATGPLGLTAGNVGNVAPFGKNTNLWVAGAKAKLAFGGLWAHLEAARNFGEDRATYSGVTTGAQNVSYKGYALYAKAGYKLDLPNVAMVSPWAEFGLGTGDSNFDYKGNRNFQSINTDYRPGGIYGRFDAASPEVLGNAVNTAGASNGLTNRVIWGLGVKATPAAVAKLTVGAQFYRYAFHSVAPSAAGVKPSRNIGSEIDVTAGWKHSDNVMAKVTLGTFRPGAWVADVKGANASLNPATMAALDLSVKF